MTPLKFHQLPLGANFKLLGHIYTKISRSFAVDENMMEAQFDADYPILEPIKESISEAILKALA